MEQPRPEYKIGIFFGFVYGIFYDNNLIYIGSTMNLNRRIKEHKSACLCKNNKKLYKILRNKFNIITDELFNLLTFKVIKYVELDLMTNPKNNPILLEQEKKLIQLHKPIGNSTYYNYYNPSYYYKKNNKKFYCDFCKRNLNNEKYYYNKHIYTKTHKQNCVNKYMKYFL